MFASGVTGDSTDMDQVMKGHSGAPNTHQLAALEHQAQSVRLQEQLTGRDGYGAGAAGVSGRRGERGRSPGHARSAQELGETFREKVVTISLPAIQPYPYVACT